MGAPACTRRQSDSRNNDKDPATLRRVSLVTAEEGRKVDVVETAGGFSGLPRDCRTIGWTDVRTIGRTWRAFSPSVFPVLCFNVELNVRFNGLGLTTPTANVVNIEYVSVESIRSSSSF